MTARPVAHVRRAVFAMAQHPVGPPPRRNRTKHPYSGTIDFQGLAVRVENTAGTVRRGTGPAGDWATAMKVHYGEIAGTEGVDGDPVDIFVGPRQHAPFAYVVAAQTAGGKYDEDKVMVGFDSKREAMAVFRAHYDRRGVAGPVRRMSVGELRARLKDPANRGRRIQGAA